MKKLIKLTPVDGMYSEIRGLSDLMNFLKQSNSDERLFLLRRLNLEDIETIDDLNCILDCLTTEETIQFGIQVNSDFKRKILSEEFHQYKYSSEKFRSLIYGALNEDNVADFVFTISNYNLSKIVFILYSISNNARNKLLDMLSDSFVTMLDRAFSQTKKPNELLSFGPRPEDKYGWDEDPAFDLFIDDHRDRRKRIFDTIEDGLDLLPLLSKALRLKYLNALDLQISGIKNSVEMSYLTLYEKRDYLKIMLIMDYKLTPVQILSVYPADNKHQYELVARLFIHGHGSTANSTLIREILLNLAKDFHYPEAQLALALMSEGELSNDSLTHFHKEFRLPFGDAKVIKEYLISVMHAIKNNTNIPETPDSISYSYAHDRKHYLEAFVNHLSKTSDYKEKVLELLSISRDETTLEENRCKFFKNVTPLKSKRILIENSSFSEEQTFEILHHIEILHKEISSVRPYPNKDRKAEKIKGLEALLIKSQSMEPHIAVSQIEKEFPDIRKGTLSNRTARLLDKLGNTNQLIV